jgi:hypothetical protein
VKKQAALDSGQSMCLSYRCHGAYSGVSVKEVQQTGRQMEQAAVARAQLAIDTSQRSDRALERIKRWLGE